MKRIIYPGKLQSKNPVGEHEGAVTSDKSKSPVFEEAQEFLFGQIYVLLTQPILNLQKRCSKCYVISDKLKNH